MLNPKVPPFCADRRFRKEIDVVSDGGARAYTPAQLHAVIFRRKMGWFFPAHGSADFKGTRRAIAAWRGASRALGPILEVPSLAVSTQLDQWPEPDVFDYGAEGVLVVDDPILVDLLVQSHVHTSSRVAIVDGGSATPSWVVDALRPLVHERPDLPIFLLHGSRVGAAEQLEQQARQALDAAANPVVDIGLAPDAARQMKGLRWARKIAAVPADVLSHNWLTDGIGAAVANRMSFLDLVAAQKHRGRDTDWVPLVDRDGDFG